MLKASSRIGDSATTLALRGLWPTSAISPTIDPGPMAAMCCPPENTPAWPVDHEEALGAHVALVHEDGAGLGVDGLAERGDLATSRLVHVGEQRQTTEVLDHRLGRPCVTACCASPRGDVAGSTYPGGDRLRRGRSARAAARPTGCGWRRPPWTRCASSGPPSTTRSGVAGERRGRLGRRSGCVGSPCRLALVAAIGPARSATARTSSWSGTRSPIVCSGSPEVQREPGPPWAAPG